MLKAAYANTPFKTPASVRGPSLKELYTQQKADDEVKSLIDSDSAVAGAAAFAKGVAAGASLPLILGGLVPWAMEVGSVYEDTRAQAELAELLKTRGVPAQAAPHHAATIHRFLKNSTQHPSQEVLDAIRPSMTTWRAAGSPIKFPTKEMAVEDFRSSMKSRGATADQIRRALPRAVTPEAAPRIGATQVTVPRVSAVLEEAADVFRKRTTSAVPTFLKAHGMHAAKHLGRAAVPAALIGGTAGVVNYLRHRSRRRALDKLRQEQARRTYYAR